jgi:CHC2 zinc finger
MDSSVSSAGLAHYRAMFGPPRSQLGTLDRDSLPPPIRYLSEHGLLASRPRGEWALIRCPSHKGGTEAHPSLNVSLVDGHFKCHACGAKGGDLIALHRAITGCGFREAVHELGGRFHGE